MNSLSRLIVAFGCCGFSVLAAAPPTATAPTPTGRSGTVTLPAGTPLLVRMTDDISSKDEPGSPFAARLETGVGGLQAGTPVYGKVQSSTEAGRAMGRSTLDVQLTQIVVNGQSVPITTSSYQAAGQASGRKAARGAAAGAAFGAIAGNAGQGAAIGAGVGAVVRGQTVTVEPGTLLEFTLAQPVTLPAAP